MASLVKVKKEVLERIKPSQQEEEKLNKFLKRLMETARAISKLDVVIVGSIGKFTWLSGDHDIDLFILFQKDVKREELEKKGLEYGKRIASSLNGKWIIKYAEHPYVQIFSDNYAIDIVPCYKIEKNEKIISAVDRSPLHLSHVLKHLPPEKRDDVRLLKQFMKGISVYSSDTKNLGFSGYVCEVLILKYKSFENVLKAAAKWKAGELIDNEKRKIDTMKKFPDQSLIVIDPVDSNRNAAAIISPENFIKFVNASQKFLKSPDKKYFFPSPEKKLSKSEITKLKKRGTKFIVLTFKKPDVVDDIVYPQARRALKRLTNLLIHNEFYVLRSYEFIGKKIIFVFELETWELPEIQKMQGPPIFSKNSVDFLKKYASCRPYLSGNIWYADRLREYKTAYALLNRFIKRDTKKLGDEGIPEKIVREFSKAKIENALKLINKNKEFSAFLRKKYFYD